MQDWDALTETLLAPELLRHEINADLIDPWMISGGIHQVYQYAIAAYAAQKAPYKLVNQVSPILGNTRKQATAIDPRAISFVAMQYHYTGIELMRMLPKSEQENIHCTRRRDVPGLYVGVPTGR